MYTMSVCCLTCKCINSSMPTHLQEPEQGQVFLCQTKGVQDTDLSCHLTTSRQQTLDYQSKQGSGTLEDCLQNL